MYDYRLVSEHRASFHGTFVSEPLSFQSLRLMKIDSYVTERSTHLSWNPWRKIVVAYLDSMK